MSVNKYNPHVWLIAEDDANRQIAIGFLPRSTASANKVGKTTVAGGWTKVSEVFESDYVPLLRRHLAAHVVMLVDFDGVDDRGAQIQSKVPDDLKSRVFVLGSKDTPETLKGEFKKGFEETGRSLAEECRSGAFDLWQKPHLMHNELELQRLVTAVKPFLFAK